MGIKHSYFILVALNSKVFDDEDRRFDMESNPDQIFPDLLMFKLAWVITTAGVMTIYRTITSNNEMILE